MKKTCYASLLFCSFFIMSCGNGEEGMVTVDSGTPPSSCGTVHRVDTTDDVVDLGAYHDFMPENLTIAVGDCVDFVMSNTHNAVEVSKDTYDNLGVVPLEDGFNVTFGETKQVRFDDPGTHYYVCQPHVAMEMIGTIIVQ